MTMVNAFDPARTAAFGAEEAALIARRQRLLGPAYRLFYDDPVHVVRGEGVWLYDADGEAYLDAYNNVAVVGHCHPHVVAALARQAAMLNTHTRYLHRRHPRLCRAAAGDHARAISPTCMFTCTGSEANDLALRIAKALHRRHGRHRHRERLSRRHRSSLAQMSPSLGQCVALGAHRAHRAGARRYGRRR